MRCASGWAGISGITAARNKVKARFMNSLPVRRSTELLKFQ
jgi:hypothetical protein